MPAASSDAVSIFRWLIPESQERIWPTCFDPYNGSDLRSSNLHSSNLHSSTWVREKAIFEEEKNKWIGSHAAAGAAIIAVLGLLARLWAASGTFLNPDEALHFRLANQATLALAYRTGLTASHPPLLTFLLHYWRTLGTSELWLRLPSVIAGWAFCWMFYKWLRKAAGELAGLVGLLFVAFLPPVVLLAAEVRQYSLLLAFLASALYFLDRAFAENSARLMAICSLFLYLALLSHYSAFLFAAALGIYALIRIIQERSSTSLISAWVTGQVGALVLAVLLYETHLSKLGAGDSRMVLQGWMSEHYLRRSYFDATRDNPLIFLIGRSFGVFQYFFEQRAVGDLMGLLFLIGVALLLRAKVVEKTRPSPSCFGLLLLLPFLVAAGASLAHVYPYGGTRHIAFLIIPAIAGVSVAIAGLAKGQWARGLASTMCVIVVCVAFGRPRHPWMNRADQSGTHMAQATRYMTENVRATDLIFADYQTNLLLGHYLCGQRPISFETAPATFEQYSCNGLRLACTDYRDEVFTSASFPTEWQRFVQAYGLKSGQTVWVAQAGWEAGLPENLRSDVPQFHDLAFKSFGKNVKIFKMTVGELLPQHIS